MRLQLQLRCYTKKDPPPSRVKPIPVQILKYIVGIALASGDEQLMAVADMIIIAFFFLLRPGEYTASKSNSTPFRLCDVTFSVGRTVFDSATASEMELAAATFVILLFTDQKNGVRGEKIGQGATGDPLLCPKQALRRRVLHLRNNGAPADSPLSRFKTPAGRWKNVTPTMISATLKAAVKFCGPNLGYTKDDVSARSLRAAGAMALLCAGVDSDIIRLIGRWRSDEMLRYLTVQAEPIMRGFSKLMLSHGNYSLLPHREVPLY